MLYVQLFLEGVITFISPCLLPMLPVYISYFAGKKDKPLGNALGFVLGFSLVFITLGAFAGALGGLIHGRVMNMVTGAIVILLGLNYMGALRLPPFLRGQGGGTFAASLALKIKHKSGLGAFVASGIFGMVFAVAWTPCVSAFLGTALLRASLQGSPGEGAFMLFVYSMGLGVPFVMSAVLVNRLKGTFDFIKKHYTIINVLAGCMLVVVGVLMMTGLFGQLMSRLIILPIY